MTIRTRIIPAALAVIAAAGGALAIASDARAETASVRSAETTSVRNADTASVRNADVRASGEASASEASARPWGFITFRSERYSLSDRAVVSTSPTTIRIADDSATTASGGKVSMFIQLGYTVDPDKPTVLRVSSGIAIRGYDFATGEYDESQAIKLGPGNLAIDAPYWAEPFHAWGNLGSATERGIFLDVRGIHIPSQS